MIDHRVEADNDVDVVDMLFIIKHELCSSLCSLGCEGYTDCPLKILHGKLPQHENGQPANPAGPIEIALCKFCMTLSSRKATDGTTAAIF